MAKEMGLQFTHFLKNYISYITLKGRKAEEIWEVNRGVPKILASSLAYSFSIYLNPQKQVITDFYSRHSLACIDLSSESEYLKMDMIGKVYCVNGN